MSGLRSKQIRSSAWLEHYTDNVGVSSSNLLGSTNKVEGLGLRFKVERLPTDNCQLKTGNSFGGLAQLARASALHAEGHRFDSDILHHNLINNE